jgi:hypothetical protein
MDAQAQFPESGAPASACPWCLEPVRSGAAKCSHCGSLLARAKVCPRCAEAIHEDAQVCRFCGHDFERESIRRDLLQQLNAHPHHLTASSFGVLVSEFSLTGFLFPPELCINGDEILIRSWRLFGLRRLDQRISTRKIASVRVLTGILFSGLSIETFGGAQGDLVIHGLAKEQAAATAHLLEQIVAAA